MNDRRILVTGANGFTGRHLIARLRHTPHVTIIGSDQSGEPAEPVDTYLPCDLADPEAVDQTVGRADPDLVFHLGGLIRAESESQLTRVNLGGFVRLRDSLRRHRAGRPVRMVTVGSVAEIGAVRLSRLPASEELICRPDTAYGRTKWLATLLARNEPADSPLEIVIARPFNLVGPGMCPHLALGSFARQVAAVDRGGVDAVECGSLETRRDVVDIRDAVQAYLLLAQLGRPRQIYNVCSGFSLRTGDLLEMLIELSGADVPVRSDPSRHPPGLPDIYGDNTKIQLETGWEPRVPIRQSLADLLASVSDAADGRLDPEDTDR